MKNTVPKSYPELLIYAGKAANGAEQYGAGIPLLQNTKIKIDAEILAMEVAMTSYANARVALKARNASTAAATRESRALITLGRENLKPMLGSMFSAAWLPLGHNASLKILPNPEQVLTLLRGYKEFYQAHPEQEVVVKDLTAVKFDDAYTELFTAVNAAETQKAVSFDLRDIRNLKATNLRKRMRGLIEEINQNIGPLDPRWKAFGFNQPGAVATPDQVTGLVVTLLGGGVAAAKWEPVAGASHYRVYKKVANIDADYVAVATSTDPNYNIEGLPSAATVDIVVAAVNTGGEGQVSEVVTLTTHP
jgi:hypothetical protein